MRWPPTRVTMGRQDMREAARDANRNAPEAHLFDSGGRRLDEVRFHPAYHLFMRTSMAAGYHSIAWEGGAGGHLATRSWSIWPARSSRGIAAR